MKIVQIVTQMESGGAQRVAYLLHQAFCARGHEAELWFLYKKRPTYDNARNVRVLFARPPRGIDYLAIICSLHSLLKQLQPEAVVTHTHYANALCNLVAQSCGVPRRISVHHNPLPTYPHLVRLVERFIGCLGTYTQSVAVSRSVETSFSSHSKAYRQHMKCIYNGIPELQCRPPGEGERARWGLPDATPLILNVGRLAKQKNQALLIDALVELPGCHLAIAGEGELRSELAACAKKRGVFERVHFLGEVSSLDVSELMSLCDVFAFPSLYEAMGLVLVEAMQAGVSIVASDIPATQEILGEAGVIVRPDPRAFAIAIRQVISDSELREQLRRRAIKQAHKFGLDRMVCEYERILHF